MGRIWPGSFLPGGFADFGGGFVPANTPVGRLVVPHQRVANELESVLFTKLDEGIGRAEVVAIRPFVRMNVLPLHVVLGGDLIELRLDQCDFLFDLPPTSVGLRCGRWRGNG